MLSCMSGPARDEKHLFWGILIDQIISTLAFSARGSGFKSGGLIEHKDTEPTQQNRSLSR